jgi:hypothetical protein
MWHNEAVRWVSARDHVYSRHVRGLMSDVHMPEITDSVQVWHTYMEICTWSVYTLGFDVNNTRIAAKCQAVFI